jgi:UrcA family protein
MLPHNDSTIQTEEANMSRALIASNTRPRFGLHRAWLSTASVLAIGLCTAVPSHATEEPMRVRVDFAHLDLADTQQAQQLYSRLREAARAVCGFHQGRELNRRQTRLACYEVALSEAVSSVNHNAVSSLHSEARGLRLAQRTQRSTSGG